MMNNWVRKVGSSSGWRATPSMNLPPSRPTPIAAPTAPKPIIKPAPMYKRTCISICGSLIP